MVRGTPKRETHPESRARAQESAVASAIGMPASVPVDTSEEVSVSLGRG